MSASPPHKVKIYDRPERKGPSPLLLVIGLVILLLIGYFVYKALHHTPAAPVPVHTGSLRPAHSFKTASGIAFKLSPDWTYCQKLRGLPGNLAV